MSIKVIKGMGNLTARETKYWLDVFKKNLKIGSEVETEFGNDNRPSTESLTKEYEDIIGKQCSQNYTDFGNGIARIKGDGSLSNGLEIPTMGRKWLGFLPTYFLYKQIYDLLEPHTPVPSGRAGWHNHLLIEEYNNKSQIEMEIPALLIENICSLITHYLPALNFITSCNYLKESGYEYFTRRSHFSECFLFISDYNYENMNMADFKKVYRGKYSALNLSFMESKDGINYDNFHIEIRLADGTVVPAQMASISNLYYAIVLKAIELSEFGKIAVFDNREKTENMKLHMFKNTNDGDHPEQFKRSFRYPSDNSTRRFSGCLESEQDYIHDKLKEECQSMIKEVTKYLDDISIEILTSLANNPLSYHIKAGRSFADMVGFFDILVKESVKKEDEESKKIRELIAVTSIDETTETKLQKKIATVLCIDESVVRQKIKELGFKYKKGMYV